VRQPTNGARARPALGGWRGKTGDRKDWGVWLGWHIAETRDQAYKDVEHGITTFFDYAQSTAAFALSGIGGELNQSG